MRLTHFDYMCWEIKTFTCIALMIIIIMITINHITVANTIITSNMTLLLTHWKYCSLPLSHRYLALCRLTHWGRVTHICVGKLTIIGPDNGLSPARRQAIIITNAGILLIGPLGTNFSEILIRIQTFSFMKMTSAKWRPFCLGLNVSMDGC